MSSSRLKRKLVGKKWYEDAFEKACEEFDFKLAHLIWERIQDENYPLSPLSTISLERFLTYLIAKEVAMDEEAYYSLCTSSIRVELDDRLYDNNKGE